MSGQEGNRGYLVQAIITLLEALRSSDWEELTLEPTHESEKIDIALYGLRGSRTYQVKSSINSFKLTDVKAWAESFERESSSDELILLLVGPCSGAVARMGSHGKVLIPSSKPLDFDILLGYASHLLAKFLNEEQATAQSPKSYEIMVRALITELSIYASDGAPITRHQLAALIRGWIQSIEIERDLKWERIDFSLQRGIENAIAGKRLGHADVVHCPELTFCDRVYRELERSHWYTIVGQPGCGKSITAWQAAKKYYDRGYNVWRPDYNAEPTELLKAVPRKSPSLLVIDDAQQFDLSFTERLAEQSHNELKVIFTSTIAENTAPNPSLISPTLAVGELGKAMAARRDEVLPIVQKYDDRISDRYMDESFESRIEACARQKTPWEFFWVLRGGWRTAYAEYDGLRLVPNANTLIAAIAVRQISSCDAGIRNAVLSDLIANLGIPGEEADRGIAHLVSLGLILISDGIFRTKHLSYAERIVAESLRDKNYQDWPQIFDIVKAAVLSTETSFKGRYWLLAAINRTDATRFELPTGLIGLFDPLMSMCRNALVDTEWAVACVYMLFRLFRLSDKEMITETERLERWFTSGTGTIAYFCSQIANEFINASNKSEQSGEVTIAESFFGRLDVERLIDLANDISVEDLYTFGELLDRLSHYRPPWATKFLAHFDWSRMRSIISRAGAEEAARVDKIVMGLTSLSRTKEGTYSLVYTRDISPFIVRVINEDPVNAIPSLHDIFWRCLGFLPVFFRPGKSIGEESLEVARGIVAELDPAKFAQSMGNMVSRDMENLARSFSMIREIDPDFALRVAELIEEKDFYRCTKEDWRTQSSELGNFVRQFCIGKDLQPARRWIVENESSIEGPLCQLFSAIAPEVAVHFYRCEKRVQLVQKHNQSWSLTAYAISDIAEINRDVCFEIVSDQTDDLEAALYELTLGDPSHIIMFFRSLHKLSEDLFANFVRRMDLSDPRAVATINRLARSQHKERKNYKKLARVACRIGGDVGILGENLLSRIDAAVAAIGTA